MTFEDLNLIPELMKAIEKEDYLNPTEVQINVIPQILEGNDVIGLAGTGSGKTAAFALPIIQLINNKYKKPEPKKPKALILAPTRELAAQIEENVKKYSEFTKVKSLAMIGGVKQEFQTKELNEGIDILIATPGRLSDLMKQKLVFVDNIQYLVLDEVDRIINLGFSMDLDVIFPKLPKDRQSLFFSATINKDVFKLSKYVLQDPIEINVETEADLLKKMLQEVLFVDHENKEELLLKIVKDKKVKATLIFTKTKLIADNLVRFLTKNNIQSIAFHSNKSQTHRNKALRKFKSREIKILIATDIAARGLHIDGITHIINYDVPMKPELYTHRVGRTARAGEKGVAYTFCSTQEREYLRDIEKYLNRIITVKVHDLHSNIASKAKGEKAKPKFKKQFGGFNKRVKKKDRPKKSGRQY